MISKNSYISKGNLAFYLILIIVIVFSLPPVQRFFDPNISIPEKALSCHDDFLEGIVSNNIGFGFGILFSLLVVPALMLYSRFIFLKYGIFLTRFSGKYSIELHFKEFLSKNVANKIFGISAFIIWLGVCLFTLSNIVVFSGCYLLNL